MVPSWNKKATSMIRKYLYVLALSALTFTSCIKDDSTAGGDSVSVISLQNPLESTYTLDQNDTLKINPTVLQTNGDKPLTYEWEVNHKLVSNDSKLVYPCNKSGEYKARLRVSNGQNIQIYEFNVNVEYAYTKGIYLLADNNNQTILSYVPTDDVKKSFKLDVLADNNPNVSFGAPRSMAFSRTFDSQKANILFLAAGNPSKIYQLDGYEMISIFNTSVGDKVNQLVASSDDSRPKVMAITGHNLYSLDVNSTNLQTQTSRFNGAVSGNVTLANYMTPWWREDLFYAHGDAYFDNSHGALLTMAIENTSIPAEILKGTFSGDTLVGMASINRQRHLALITCQKSTGTFYFNYINPGYYSSDATKRIAANVLYRIAMPASTGIENGSVVRSARSKNIVYYTKGNAVYAHNVLANGTFPTTPLISVGNSTETIVDMVFSDDDNLIYIATNDPSSTMQGSLYCYDAQTNSLRWSKQHITKRIVKALYRNK